MPTGLPSQTESAAAELVLEPAAPAAEQRSAILDVSSHVRLWTVTALGLAVDLWSKDRAFHVLGQGGRRVLIENVLEFQTMLNPGALFGIGRGQTTFFIIASILALGLVMWMFAQNSPRRRLLHLALGAILAGALGNMYDRIFVQLVPHPVRTAGGGYVNRYVIPTGQRDGFIHAREYPPTRNGAEILISPEAFADKRLVGYVRDFIKIPTKALWGEVWPWVFNVADSLLVCGVLVLAGYLWVDRRHTSARPAPGAPAAEAADLPGEPSDEAVSLSNPAELHRP
ncbi:MAG: Lipoprotein signal peptidase [Phycisphaerae bacterium]|nr:Lipoprotein signal peptidase [Phycisphaerae bacterium]